MKVPDRTELRVRTNRKRGVESIIGDRGVSHVYRGKGRERSPITLGGVRSRYTRPWVPAAVRRRQLPTE